MKKKHIIILFILFLICSFLLVPNHSKSISQRSKKMREGEYNVNIVDGTVMNDVENLIGRYQFNYTGASNYLYQHSPGTLNTQYSHLPELADYENDLDWASSSGGYIDKNYNIIDGVEGSVKKAYLTFEINNVEEPYKYPITVVYGGEDGVPKASKEVYIETFYDRNVEAVGTNELAYVDITDWFIENGYGWYYVCNIPFVRTDDTSADWKIIVIEENEKLPVRMLRLQFGSATTKSSYKYLVLDGDGIVTKKNGTVTGQLLYNLSNGDGVGSGRVQIGTGNSDSYTKYTYTGIESVNGIRQATAPITFQKTRNTIPILTKTNYVKNYYYMDSLDVGSDVELLDIDGTNDYHNIIIPNNQKKIVLRYNSGGSYTLVTNIVGMAVDIDVSDYVSVQKASLLDNDEGRVTISGTTTCISDIPNTGLYDGRIKVTIDSSLVLDSNTIEATFKDENGVETILDSSMWTVDGNNIIFVFGSNQEGRTLSGASLSYQFKSMANKAVDSYTITNTVKASGYLIASGVNDTDVIDTNFYIDNIGWTTSVVDIPVQNDLFIDPNGGTYKGSSEKSFIRGITYHESYELQRPNPMPGYAFWKWEIVSEDNGASIIDKDHVSMGYSDTEIKAIYYIDRDNNGVADIEEYLTIKYCDGLNNTIFSEKIYEKLLVNDDMPLYGETIPPRDGYIFTGWSPEITDRVVSDVIYTAIWKEDRNHNGISDDEEEKYVVTYSDNLSGTIFDDQITMNLIVGDNTPLFSGELPKREKYIFTGWSPEVEEIVHGNKMYLATWEEDFNEDGIVDQTQEKYTITYHDSSEAPVFPDEVYNNVLLNLKTPEYQGNTPVKKGYVFLGWSPEIAEKVTKNVTYSSIWGIDENENGIEDEEDPIYSITYRDGVNNEIFEEQMYRILVGLETKKFEGEIPTREGFIFAGWDKEISNKVTSDIVYTAIWKRDSNHNGISDDEEIELINPPTNTNTKIVLLMILELSLSYFLLMNNKKAS